MVQGSEAWDHIRTVALEYVLVSSAWQAVLGVLAAVVLGYALCGALAWTRHVSLISIIKPLPNGVARLTPFILRGGASFPFLADFAGPVQDGCTRLAYSVCGGVLEKVLPARQVADTLIPERGDVSRRRIEPTWPRTVFTRTIACHQTIASRDKFSDRTPAPPL